jgi:type VI protein secretion system component VasF
MRLARIALKKRNPEREQMETLELLIATDESAASNYRRQKREALRQRINRRVQTAVRVVMVAFLLLWLVGLLLAWLDLLPPPACGRAVHWWSWCRNV